MKSLFGKFRMIILVLLVIAGLGLLLLSRCGIFSKKPRNVILISIDTCRADHLSCYGYPSKTTPNIDAIAAEGILFEKVVAPAPITLPSHASMLTGTIPVYHGVHDNMDYRLAESNITLAEILKEAGFATGGIVSALVLDSKFGIGQGFDNFNDRFESTMESNAVEQRRGDETTRFAINWLDENKDERFFYFLHYYDPHIEYQPPEPFASQYAHNLYAGEIAYTDHCIGQILAKLKELDLYDSTLVIITSDHGEMLGEHGENTHAYFIYESAIKVPLVFKVPGRNKPVRIKQLAGLIDIVPTVCSLLDIDPPAAVAGVDLSTCFDGGKLSADRGLYCESLQATKYNANSLLGLVTGRFKYIKTTRPELYDLADDPAESNNLIDRQPDRARILKDRLAQIIQRSVRGNSDDSKVDLDGETRHRLESLGYVGNGIVEDFGLEQAKEDPKDTLDYYLMHLKVMSLIAQKRYDPAERIAEEMIRIRPDFAFGYQRAGEIASGQGDHSSAVAHFQQALKFEPDSVDTHNNLGVALKSLGKFEQAIEHYQKILQIDPGHANAHNNLGVVLESLGKFEQAIEHYQKALQTDPGHANAHNNLAAALARQNKVARTIAHWEETLRSDPDHIDSHNNLAWLLATTADDNVRDPAEAVRLAERACQLTQYSRPDVLDTLAAAYAADGDFAKAVETAEKALSLVSDSEKLTNWIQERIELYKANKPYYGK